MQRHTKRMIKDELLPPYFWEKVDSFIDLLLTYNKTHNITGAKTKESALKNIEDSIYPLEFLDLSSIKNSIDIGSGAGFPSLILALVLPQVHFGLCEPIAKKSAFLHLAKTHLGLENVTIYTNRIEQLEPWDVDLISSRAVTNTKALITLCQKFITLKTTLLFYKGEAVGEEIQGLSHYQIFQNEKRHYLVLKDIHVA